MKLRGRLMYLNLGVVILAAAGIIGFLLVNTYISSGDSAKKEIQMRIENVAKDMESILVEAEKDASALGDTLEIMVKSKGADRNVAIDHLKEILNNNHNYLYAWAAFESDAFDSNDKFNMTRAGSDNTGRFMPSIGRTGDGLHLDFCTDVEKKEYYTVPRDTGEFYITDPTTYNLDGEDVTTVTFTTPMFHNGSFIGVAGVDISLKTLRDISSRVEFFESGFGRLLSQKGTVLSHTDEKMLNQPGGEFKGDSGDGILKKIENGEIFSNVSWSNYMNKKVQKIYAPVKFRNYDIKWAYSAVVPYDEMMAEATKLIIVMVTISVIIIILMGMFMFRNSNYVVKGITTATEHAVMMSELDLTKDVPDEFLKAKDELGDLGRAFNVIGLNMRELVKNIKDTVGTLSTSSQELNSISEEVAMSSEEVSCTVEELANGATSQAGETEAGSDQVEELNDLMRGNQDAVGQVVSSSEDVTNLVEDGLKVVGDLIEKTSQSGEASQEIYGLILNTNKSADEISKASEVIASIAEQTNLLALNAAIEGARAGEAGKGFAVVADEIRKLAEQSTESTKDIDKVLEELLGNSRRAVKRMEEVSKTIESQSTSVSDTEEKYRDISQAINSANISISHMNEASIQMNNKKDRILEIMQSLSAIAQENAASTQEVSASMQEQSAAIEEVASSSEKLLTVATDLDKAVSKFKV